MQIVAKTRYHTVTKTRYRTITRTRYRTVTRIRYRTITRIRYRTVTRSRYHTVTRIHYREITRVRMQVRTRYVTRTLVRYRYVTKVTHVTRVRTVVNHKVIYTTVRRLVTIVRYKTRVVVRHKTVVSAVLGYTYHRLPTTGRFNSPDVAWRGALPPVEARVSIARLGIARAPAWARAFIKNPDGSFRYDIVPAYGVTRFSASARFGRPGLTLLSGHDDVYGSIFRYLNRLRRGDVVRIWEGKHTYRYTVTAVMVVAPNDTRLLNRAYPRPALALVSCTPYWVDTYRVVVIAQLS